MSSYKLHKNTQKMLIYATFYKYDEECEINIIALLPLHAVPTRRGGEGVGDIYWYSVLQRVSLVI